MKIYSREVHLEAVRLIEELRSGRLDDKQLSDVVVRLNELLLDPHWFSYTIDHVPELLPDKVVQRSFQYRPPQIADPDPGLERFAEKMREHTKKRQPMKRALRSVITPIMRRAGFTGNSPFFRRLNPQRYDLFMFDFCRGHDGFGIQVGQCTPDDVGEIPGQKASPQQIAEFYALVPPEKMTPEHLRPNQRARVQPRHGSQPGDFFEYGQAQSPEDYQRIALSVVPYVEKIIAGFEDYARFMRTEPLYKR